MELILFTIGVVIITLFVMWVFISVVIFILQELNHSIKNIKRAARQFLWDMEWRFGRR